MATSDKTTLHRRCHQLVQRCLTRHLVILGLTHNGVYKDNGDGRITVCVPLQMTLSHPHKAPITVIAGVLFQLLAVGLCMFGVWTYLSLALARGIRQADVRLGRAEVVPALELQSRNTTVHVSAKNISFHNPRARGELFPVGAIDTPLTSYCKSSMWMVVGSQR